MLVLGFLYAYLPGICVLLVVVDGVVAVCACCLVSNCHLMDCGLVAGFVVCCLGGCVVLWLVLVCAGFVGW